MNIEIMRELQAAYNAAKDGDIDQMILIKVSPLGRKSVNYVVNSDNAAADMLEYAEGEI